MRRSALAACCGVAAFLTAGSGSAAHENTTLDVRQSGSTATISTGVAPAGAPTAVLAIFSPRTTRLDVGQPPGTVLGSARALLQGPEHNGLFTGPVVVARTDDVQPAERSSCPFSRPARATWLLRLQAGGKAFVVPAYVRRSQSPGLGSALVHMCLPAHAALQRLAFSVTGVYGAATGTWIAVWVPFAKDGTTPAGNAVVAAVTTAASGDVSLVARPGRGGAALQGRVTQGGKLRKDATVTILGGTRPDRLRRMGRARVGPAGRYRFLARTGTVFRAHATAGKRLEHVSQYCYLGGFPFSALRAPCTGTFSGFTARSTIVRT